MFNAPSKDLLFQKYVIEHKAINKIAAETGYSVGTIYNYLVNYKIPRRSISDYEVSQKVIEHITQIGLNRKGKIASAETRAKMSLHFKGKYRNKTKYGGHTKQRTDGYICVYFPNHPNATKDGYVMEHILVMEEYIGRYLKPDEVVHHKDKIRNHNVIENLQLMTFKEHARFHMIERYRAKKKGR